MKTVEAGRVYLVGAGPGDPELLTLKAARMLGEADVVLHDALVSPEILALAAQARLEPVGKRAGGCRTPQLRINERMIRLAREGNRVRQDGREDAIYRQRDRFGAPRQRRQHSAAMHPGHRA